MGFHQAGYPRLDHLDNGVRLRRKSHGSGTRSGENLTIPIEDANSIDLALPEGQVLKQAHEVGGLPDTQGECVFHGDLYCSYHFRRSFLLVLYPCERFLLHTDDTVNTADEQERQHQEHNQTKSKPHRFRANDSARLQGKQLWAQRECRGFPLGVANECSAKHGDACRKYRPSSVGRTLPGQVVVATTSCPEPFPHP